MYLSVGSIIGGVMQYLHPVEFTLCIILLVACLVAAILIVRNVIKEIIHPSKSSALIDDELSKDGKFNIKQ